ncbi:MAG: metallophosphoesterase [Candidatus Hydrogenedentes bacterium]|nr:metallophosphoesterase [Candidatus Hydrogenedentota bacterium]
MKKTNHPISRREFLGRSIASGAALTFGLPAAHALAADGASSRQLDRWILLADTHICQDRNREEHGIKPAEKLAEARAQILELESPPSGLIIAGDCAYLHGEAADYAVLGEDLAPLMGAGIPAYMSMGNHDNRERFWDAFPEARARSAHSGLDKHVHVVDAPNADWFILDSNKETDFTPGELGEAQLAWLAAELDKRPGKPALLVAHHYPTAKKDDNGLLDFDALWSVIHPRSRVKAYLFGHSHRWAYEQRDGVHLVNLPALAWLFGDQAAPRAWTQASIAPDGMDLHLHCLNDRIPPDGGRLHLPWRA